MQRVSKDSHLAEFPLQVQEHQTPAVLLLLIMMTMMLAVTVN